MSNDQIDEALVAVSELFTAAWRGGHIHQEEALKRRDKIEAALEHQRVPEGWHKGDVIPPNGEYLVVLSTVGRGLAFSIKRFNDRTGGWATSLEIIAWRPLGSPKEIIKRLAAAPTPEGGDCECGGEFEVGDDQVLRCTFCGQERYR